MLLDTIFCLVSLFSLIISPGKKKKLKRTHDTRMVTDLSFCEDNARPRTRISAGNENIVSGRKSRKMEQEINTTQTTRPWGQKKKNGKRDNWLRELSFTGRVNKDSASERQRKSNTLSEKCTPQKKKRKQERENGRKVIKLRPVYWFSAIFRRCNLCRRRGSLMLVRTFSP